MVDWITTLPYVSFQNLVRSIYMNISMNLDNLFDLLLHVSQVIYLSYVDQITNSS